MTATVPTTSTVSAPPSVAGPVTLPRTCHSEWTKFRTLRSTWWALGVGVLLSIGLGFAGSIDAASSGQQANDPVHVAAVSQFGGLFSQLAILVVAALFVTGEYGTGMIRATMTVVPRRIPALVAKAAVIVAVVLPVTFVCSLVTFEIGNAVWQGQGHPGASLTDPGVFPIVVGAALYMTVAAVFAIAVGALLRNTAAATAVLVGVFFVVPAVVSGIDVFQGIAPYLPSNAGGALAHLNLSELKHTLPGWAGLGLFAGYTAVLGVAAGMRLRRTDV